jgi:cell shape-determining protein MreC
MKTYQSQSFLTRNAVAIVAGSAALLGLFPAKWLGWLGGVREPVAVVVAPISGPLRTLSGWLRPAEPTHAESQELRQLREQRDTFERLYLQSLDDIHKLEMMSADLARFRQSNPGVRVDPLVRPVIADSSDISSGIVRIRAGTSDNVTTGTVATVRGEHLVGRVVTVNAKTCLVQPITTKSAGALGVIVLIDTPGQPTRALQAVLRPVGDGTLAGDLKYELDPATMTAVSPRPGNNVRLRDDESWPSAAQNLLVGTVESVAPSPTDPNRQRIIVRPRIARLDRVGEVMLLVTAEPGGTP